MFAILHRWPARVTLRKPNSAATNVVKCPKSGEADYPHVDRMGSGVKRPALAPRRSSSQWRHVAEFRARQVRARRVRRTRAADKGGRQGGRQTRGRQTAAPESARSPPVPQLRRILEPDGFASGRLKHRWPIRRARLTGACFAAQCACWTPPMGKEPCGMEPGRMAFQLKRAMP